MAKMICKENVIGGEKDWKNLNIEEKGNNRWEVTAEQAIPTLYFWNGRIDRLVHIGGSFIFNV